MVTTADDDSDSSEIDGEGTADNEDGGGEVQDMIEHLDLADDAIREDVTELVLNVEQVEAMLENNDVEPV